MLLLQEYETGGLQNNIQVLSEKPRERKQKPFKSNSSTEAGIDTQTGVRLQTKEILLKV